MDRVDYMRPQPGPTKRTKPPKESVGMSLSALLDGDGGESANNDDGASDADSRSDEGSSHAEEDEGEVLAPSDDEDIEVEGDALNKLDSFIDDLSHRKRKASDMAGPLPTRSIKRRVIPERTEAGIEGEFSVPSGTHAGSSLIESILLLPDVVPSVRENDIGRSSEAQFGFGK
jgi:hypothetical protein